MYNWFYRYKNINCIILESNETFDFVFEEGLTIKCPKDLWYLKEFWERIPHLLNGDLRYYKIKHNDIVVDCGAYIGIFTIYASKKAGEQGKVIAFEPDPLNFNRLLSIIKINNASNVIAINKATWSKNGKMNFDYRGKGTSTLFTNKKISPIVSKITSVNNIIKVPTVTLDKELSKIGNNRVSFIKTDIEGAEIETLKGAKKTLEKYDVNLAIASNHIVNGEYTRFEVEKILKKMGYFVKTEYPPHMTTYAWKNKN
ncbi:MAG: FkbM family methyltransferase [Candidatus Micrarchaeia archaeon]